MKHTVDEKIRKRLLKKWRGLLTRYTKLIDNECKRTYQRGMTRVTVDCSVNKNYYLNEIEKANKIITELG